MRDARPFVWRALSRLMPQSYRQQWADEVLRTHVDAAGGPSHAHGLHFWCSVAGDVVITAVRLRLDTAASHGKGGNVFDLARYNGRLALRGLVRAPGFTLAVVLTLALGLGANATIFTVLDRLLLSPPEHMRDAELVRRIATHGIGPFSEQPRQMRALTFSDYESLREVRGFAAVAGYSTRSLTLGRGTESERIATEWASASYFPLIGVTPLLGRFYVADEDRIGAEPAVVLSWGFWQRRFGGDPAVLGQRLDIGKGSYTVVGIAPKGFTGVDLAPIDVWLPLQTVAGVEQGDGWVNADFWYWFGAIVRLDQASPEASTLSDATSRYRASRAHLQSSDANATVVASPVVEARGPDRPREAAVAQLLGLVALMVLLIACANAGNLFLARGVQRRRAFAVQSALGVGRGRLMLQLLGEAALLSAGAGILAILLSQVVTPALFRTLLPQSAPPSANGLRVLWFTFAAAAATIVLAGMVPALRAARVDPFEALRSARASTRSSWFRSSLLALQAALSVVLLIGAGLFLRSLEKANHLALGVDLEPVVLDLELSDGTRFGEKLARVAYPILERLRAHPAVQSATLTSLPPFSGYQGIDVQLPGPDSIIVSSQGPFVFAADRDYFRTLGIPILAGRPLTEADEHPGAQPVAVVDRSMARTFWKGEANALGQCILIGTDHQKAPCTTVVGIAGEIVDDVRSATTRMRYYVPTRHPGLGFDGGQVVIVRLRDQPKPQIAAIAALARAAAPEIRFIDAFPLSVRIEPQLRAWKLGATLLSAFGILALIVAGSGLYSVLAFDVAQRRFELGLRSALGASPARLVRAIVARVTLVVVLGMGAGILAAVVLAGLAQSMLFGVAFVDPVSYAVAIAILCAGSLVAIALPAWRATRVDPRIAMAVE